MAHWPEELYLPVLDRRPRQPRELDQARAPRTRTSAPATKSTGGWPRTARRRRIPRSTRSCGGSSGPGSRTRPSCPFIPPAPSRPRRHSPRRPVPSGGATRAAAADAAPRATTSSTSGSAAACSTRRSGCRRSCCASRRWRTTSRSSPTSAVDRGVSFAPHGKTTMSPEIFRRQAEAGAWAITVATTVAGRGGGRRRHRADPDRQRGRRRRGAGLDRRPARPRRAGADRLRRFGRAASSAWQRAARPVGGGALPVLVEIGVRRRADRRPDGRRGRGRRESDRSPPTRCSSSGSRCTRESSPVRRARSGRRPSARWRRSTRDVVAAARAALRRVLGSRRSWSPVAAARTPTSSPTSSARPGTLPLPVRVVLRSGAYVTHDHGIYERGSPFGMRAARAPRASSPRSRSGRRCSPPPSPGLAIGGAGRRDLPVDQDLPVVIKVRGADDAARASRRAGLHGRRGSTTSTRSSRWPAAHRLAVGDLVAFGISHPCTAFQLWREALVVDDADGILDVYELRF